MDDIAKIRERVAKLLAMAKDSSSPNEAAIAAQRARALMDKHQIEEHELHPQGAPKFGWEHADKAYKYTPDWKDRLCVQIAKFNDCIARKVTTNQRGYNRLAFFGHEADVAIAREMYTRLCEAVEKWCKDYMRSIGHGSYYVARIGDTYKKAMSHELVARIQSLCVKRDAIEMAPGTALVVFKMAAVEEQFGEARYVSKNMNRNMLKRWDDDRATRDAYNQGRIDGQRIQIRPEVE